METWHIKIEHEKALDSKKQLLSSEINLLHLIGHIKNYSVFRKRETIIANKIKLNLSSIKSKLNLLSSTLPKQESKPKIEPQIQKVKKIVKQEEKSSYQKELEDIQAKLARLG